MKIRLVLFALTLSVVAACATVPIPEPIAAQVTFEGNEVVFTLASEAGRPTFYADGELVRHDSRTYEARFGTDVWHYRFESDPGVAVRAEGGKCAWEFRVPDPGDIIDVPGVCR